jgi:DNA-binding response OmpR family regulator
MAWSVPGNARLQVEKAGAATVVAKPFNVAELRSAARRARRKK